MAGSDVSRQALPQGRLALLGLGVENRALAAWLARHGERFWVCDANPDLDTSHAEWISSVEGWRLGSDYLDSLHDFDVLFRSPGIHALHPRLCAAREAGVLVHSQTQLFLERCTAFVVGVTGTKGKGTTSSLLASMLAAAGRTHRLAGNIGTPPISFVDDLSADEIIVLELSSFQLQDLTCSPSAAILLPVGTDHLDVHVDRHEYIEAKAAICSHQEKTDWVVSSASCETTQALAGRSSGHHYQFTETCDLSVDGVFVVDRQICWRTAGQQSSIVATDVVPLKGLHNLANACAAVAAAKILGLDASQIEAGLRTFEPLPHRLEEVGTIGGVLFVNDSLGTTPVAAAAAIQTYADRGPVVIAGGASKGADFEIVGQALAQKARALILLGEEGPKIAAAAERAGYAGAVVRAANMQLAVSVAGSLAEEGGVVLLAPACASFGMFRDYAQRGEAFRQAVAELRTAG
ncbi:MAG: UDP-N-acetylmuramoyl-L-alanine--D-glutamate ligase [Gemmatimonadetes bacterium]|jgi:UDP-N-acetylmuramoylalanine--D-glutamate ligase|nr:UDP-N-acetylmuramoyl-L-alanine--D-glutamate ligase [Gemmatimonadota bacterium]MBT7864574.1 UDP-N-acetylmuramoyl-L-alanine--D-glutamate ligase [Gemmatimonadota bacterium]